MAKRKKVPWGSIATWGGFAIGTVLMARRIYGTARPPIIPPTDQPLIKAEGDKIKSMASFHRDIYGGDGRVTPNEPQMDSLNMFSEMMRKEEDDWPFVSQPEYREGITQFYHNEIGIDVTLPMITGYIASSGMVVYDRLVRPDMAQTPMTCPKCGVTLANPGIAMAHVVNDHQVTQDSGAIAEAATIWSAQPTWALTTTGVMGGTYDLVRSPMTGWSLDSLAFSVQGMAYSLAMGIGTVGTLQALSTTLVYCLV
jgi:hypothetical protein